MDAEFELNLFDSNDSWSIEYQKIRVECMENHDFEYEIALRPDNRLRNRYGDVSPFDFNRIILKRDDIDYINASCVSHPLSRRAYILAQGPLPQTCGHFWLMIWEQNSPAILMLSKLVEKNMIKCHKYYPDEEDDNEMIFDDVRLKVVFIGVVESNENFVTRLFKLQDLETEETKTILQFHYVSWPDFGVPVSPAAFLQYLYAVRKCGVLDDPTQQVVIHCSAGIGRSGTFCLVDICLQLLENGYEVNVLHELTELRKCRMGLIQTPEQLRFSYLAIVEGAKAFVYAEDKVNSDSEYGTHVEKDLVENLQNSSGDEGYLRHDGHLLNGNLKDNDFSDNHKYPYLTGGLDNREKKVSDDNNSNHGDDEGCKDDRKESQSSDKSSGAVRRRARDERIKKTSEIIEKMKEKQKEAETNPSRRGYRLYAAATVGVTIALIALAVYKLV